MSRKLKKVTNNMINATREEPAEREKERIAASKQKNP